MNPPDLDKLAAMLNECREYLRAALADAHDPDVRAHMQFIRDGLPTRGEDLVEQCRQAMADLDRQSEEHRKVAQAALAEAQDRLARAKAEQARPPSVPAAEPARPAMDPGHAALLRNELLHKFGRRADRAGTNLDQDKEIWEGLSTWEELDRQAAASLAHGFKECPGSEAVAALDAAAIDRCCSSSLTVSAMLHLAGVHSGDVVYDLGCGDARILLAAARLFGARGVGIEADPETVQRARALVHEAGMESLVTIRNEDLKHTLRRRHGRDLVLERLACARPGRAARQTVEGRHAHRFT